MINIVHKGLGCLAALFAFAPSLFAQDQSQGWTLKQCLDHALAHNINLQQDALSIEESEATLSQGKGLLFPSLSFSTNHSFNWRPWSAQTVNLSGGTLTTTTNDFSYHGSYGLNANWTIWDGGKRHKNVEAYEMQSKASALTKEQNANNIEEQIAQYFAQILYQAEAVRVADSTLSAAVLLRDRARDMVESGKMSRADLAQLEAQVAQDEYALVSNETQLSTNKLALKQLLELTGPDAFDIVMPEVSDESVLEPLPNKEDAYQKALAIRPEILSGQLSVDQAVLQEDIAKRGAYPTLGMSAGVQTSHSSGLDRAVGEQIKQNVNNSIGLSLSVPILDNRSTRTSKAKARIQRQQSELSLQETRKTLYRQVESYWLNATSAQRQFIAAQASVASARSSYDLVSEKFSLGLNNIAELSNAKSNLLQAQQQMLQCKFTALLNIAMLRFYSGEELQF